MTTLLRLMRNLDVSIRNAVDHSELMKEKRGRSMYSRLALRCHFKNEPEVIA